MPQLAKIWQERPELKNAIASFRRNSRSKLLHYSSLQDMNLAEAIMHDGRIAQFTDNAGNKIYYGFYGCDEKEEQVENCQHPNLCRQMYDSGVLFGKINPAIIERNSLRNNRFEGEKGFFNSVRLYFKGEFPGRGRIIPHEQTWLGIMEKRERAGKVEYPYIYLINDVNPMTIDRIVDDVMPYLLLGASVVLAVSGVGATVSATVLAAAKSVSSTISKFIKSGELTFGDLSLLTSSLAPVLVGDADRIGGGSVLGMKLEDVKKIVDSGNKIYQSIASGNIAGVAQELGIENIGDIEKIITDITKSDVYSLFKDTGIPLLEIEKTINSMQLSEMAKNWMLESDSILRQLPALDSPLQEFNIQQFLVNAVSMPDLAGAIPGSVLAVRGIVQNMDVPDETLATLIKIAQGEGLDIDDNNMLDLIKDSMLERAKGFVGSKFVLPSNIPTWMQSEVRNYIKSKIKNIDVISVNGANGNAPRFYPQFP